MRCLVAGLVFLLVEWLVMLRCMCVTDELRLVMVGLTPGVLELLKYMIVSRGWPRRYSGEPAYALAVEVIRYILVVVGLFVVASPIKKSNSVFSIAYCLNFFVLFFVGVIANAGKNK